jgi:muconate cycloisomerase
MLDIAKVVSGARFAKAGVEVALHDAWARHLGVPLHTLLGGPFRTSVDVTRTLGSVSVSEIDDEALQKVETAMYSSFKLKMGALVPDAHTARVLRLVDGLADKAGACGYQRAMGPPDRTAAPTAPGRWWCGADRAADTR